jgi:DNA-binding NtrC family response regulator
MTLNIFMDNVETQIKSRVDSFVGELSALVKKAALEAVANALKAGDGAAPSVAKTTGKKRGPAPGAAKAAKTTKAAPAASAASAAAAKRKAGQKRSPDEIAKTTEKLLQYIVKNSGQRIEEIAKGVGNSTKELTLPVKKLLSEKKISAKGEKRATRYFAGNK